LLSNEQRIADLERALALFMSAFMMSQHKHYRYMQQGGRIRFTFEDVYDGSTNIDYEPAQ